MRLAEVLTAGYNHDHSSATMPASAQELAEEIGKLQGRGVTEISIVAHSMGGLIAKAALDRIATDGKASDYTHIELHAFGTPWGGYALADILRYLPATEAVSMAIGYPMGPDIGPGSNFMKNLSKPLPANFELYLYVGSADAVAKPELSDTRRRYAEVEAIATSIIVIEDYEHTDYRKAGLNIVEASRKTTADDSKLGATGNYVVVARRVRVGTINRAEETRSVVH